MSPVQLMVSTQEPESGEPAHRPLSSQPPDAAAKSDRATVVALFRAGRLSEAESLARELTRQDPADAFAWKAWGAILTQRRCHQESLPVLRQAIRLSPGESDAHNSLGVALMETGHLEEAVSAYREALQLRPDYAEAHANLANALQQLGRLQEALESVECALRIQPGNAAAHYTRGLICKDIGIVDGALAGYGRAVELEPACLDYRSGLLALRASAAVSPFREQLAEARQWERAALPDAERATARDRRFAVTLRAGRRLRVGIASAELGRHAVACFLKTWLRAVDRKRLEIYLYPTTVRPESETEQLRSLADQWRSLAGQSAADAAARIRADQVDILLDTTGHTRDGRLDIFAHRAAPVQCHYIGYFASTGLTEMDYWLADEVLVPPELDTHFCEQVWRLPRPWVAYSPWEETPPPAWRPADSSVVRFGSFNNLSKLSESCLALWAKVLEAVPAAHLILKDRRAGDRLVQARIIETLAQYGVAPRRVVFLPHVGDWRQHMSLYDQVDVALDTIPLNSGTTGFDALWMGVPLVTLAGDWMGGRIGASMLTGLGRPEWTARTVDEYVTVAQSLAHDVELRRQLRGRQREQMRCSPLCDGAGLARSLEQAFADMFDRWWQRTHGD